MAKQEVEDGRLIRRKEEPFDAYKFPQVTPLGNLGQPTPGVNDLTVGTVVGGELLNTDGHGILTRDDLGVNQELQELKDKYEQLVEALRAHGINVADGEELTAEQEIQLAFVQQQTRPPAAVDTDKIDELLARLQRQYTEGRRAE